MTILLGRNLETSLDFLRDSITGSPIFDGPNKMVLTITPEFYGRTNNEAAIVSLS